MQFIYLRRVSWISELVKAIPFVALFLSGVWSILEVFVPVLRPADFARWEVDDGDDSYIQVGPVRKRFGSPRVIAQGYVSDATACGIALGVGTIFIFLGVFGIRHTTGYPVLLPDLFSRF